MREFTILALLNPTIGPALPSGTLICGEKVDERRRQAVDGDDNTLPFAKNCMSFEGAATRYFARPRNSSSTRAALRCQAPRAVGELGGAAGGAPICRLMRFAMENR